MDVHVREDLYVLDYEGNIKDTIFNSEDKRTPGYAYNINVKESNTGYSDLTFSMPNTILDDEANKIKNPKLLLLTPLVRLRYRRTVYYTGTQPIKVREPEGYGDKVGYIEKTYNNTYPDNIIEDYTMDYIVQPATRKRDNLKVDVDYVAIDYPRFMLSKKRVGMGMSSDTITKPEWSLFQNKPLDVPGSVKYNKWSKAFNDVYPAHGIDTSDYTWDPSHALEYPLDKDTIADMIDHYEWEYGVLATVFYFPIKIQPDIAGQPVETYRFKGKLYKNNSYLCLHIYDLYENTTEGLDPELHTERYGWEWSQLAEVEPYLGPNNALNYLRYILDGTGWTVATRINPSTGVEEPDVDLEEVEVTNPKGSADNYKKEKTIKKISVENSGSNAYNSITDVSKGFQLYPKFNCLDKTVALHIFAGKNYGLTYRLGTNLKDDENKLDGEKVITKLYVAGGKNYNGSDNINIGTAERSWVKELTGFYTDISHAPTTDVEGYWCIVDPDLNLLKPWITDETHVNRKVYAFDNTQDTWSEAPKNAEGNYYVEVNGEIKVIDIASGIALDGNGDWDPNDPSYILGRSPWGANYILNFKWSYQNGWITKDQILDIYNYEEKIDELNEAFLNRYNDQIVVLNDNYREAANQYDVDEKQWRSKYQSLQNKYHYDVDHESQGFFYAFDELPGLLSNCEDYTLINGKYYWHILGHTTSDDDLVEIPLWQDFTSHGGDLESQYKPYLKGSMRKMLETCDRYDGPDYDASFYVQYLNLSKKIDMDTQYPPGFPYYVNSLDSQGQKIRIRSSAGNVETWNEAVGRVGDGSTTESGMIVYYYKKWTEDRKKVDDCLRALEVLQEEYDDWFEACKAIRAEEYNLYGDFFVEGNYTNGDQPYSSILFIEGNEASDKYCIPEITYGVNVIDATGLFEYREPQVTKYRCTECEHTSLNEFTRCPLCGGEKIEVQRDKYNDLVHQLLSVGQIVPKAGDYVTIYDEPMGLYGVPGLITEISRRLDKPDENKITLDTAYTDAEDLVGNVITATNTVLNNADIYARTAVLNKDGTIDPSSIRTSLDNTNANIAIVGTGGNMLLDSNGMRAAAPGDNAKAVRYTGSGIYITNNFSPNANTDDNGHEVVWTQILSNNGIDADMLVGSIDAKRLAIRSGSSDKLLMDENGLVLKTNANKPYHLTNFDVNNALTWGTTNNIAAYIGTQANGNTLAYFNGYLVATAGSNIAGWITDANSFYHTNNGTISGTKDIWLSPTGINGYVNNVNNNYTFYVNGNFGVTTGGALYATGANIAGTLNAWADSHIGPWTVTNGAIYNTKTSLSVNTNGVYVGTDGIGLGQTNNYGTAEYPDIHSKFEVTNIGQLYASNATISGNIRASSGSIGDWIIGKFAEAEQTTGFEISGLTNYSGKGGIELLKDGKYCGMKAVGSVFLYAGATRSANNGGATFEVTHAGQVRCSNLQASGGNIGNWNISNGSISAGGTSFGSSGQVVWQSGDYFFAVGNGSNHPVASGLSIQNGIHFYTQLSTTGAETGSWRGSWKYEYFDNRDWICLRLNDSANTGFYLGYTDANRLSWNGTTNNFTIRNTGTLFLRPSNGIQIHGKYTGNTDAYHNGYSGEINLSSLGSNKLRFVNGIFVGTG